MPLPDTSKDPVMPESLAAISNEMERTYITNDQWYRQRETWWHAVSDFSPSGHAPSTSSESSEDGDG
jgi:hypothetical protein